VPDQKKQSAADSVEIELSNSQITISDLATRPRSSDGKQRGERVDGAPRRSERGVLAFFFAVARGT